MKSIVRNNKLNSFKTLIFLFYFVLTIWPSLVGIGQKVKDYVKKKRKETQIGDYNKLVLLFQPAIRNVGIRILFNFLLCRILHIFIFCLKLHHIRIAIIKIELILNGVCMCVEGK